MFDSKWLPDVWNPQTSPDAGFLPWWCSARPFLQLSLVPACWQPYMPMPWSKVVRFRSWAVPSYTFFSHFSGTSSSLSHLSIGCCSRTVQDFLLKMFLGNSIMVFMLLWLTNGKSCRKSSVFTPLNFSLDCWLWPRYTYTMWPNVWTPDHSPCVCFLKIPFQWWSGVHKL